jgi:hypothetical protein
MNGPRQAIQTADQAAAVIWASTIATIRRLEDARKRWPNLSTDTEAAWLDGGIWALYVLTGEPPDSIRARARMVALVNRDEGQPELFT